MATELKSDKLHFNEFTINLKEDFEKQLMCSRILLDSFRLSDESSRKTGAYQDPRYLPFYYYLAKHVNSKSLVEIGFRLGLASGCFFKRCKTVEHFLAFQEKDHELYSPRLAHANIRDVYKGEFNTYVGKVLDENFREMLSRRTWDLFFINENVSHDLHKSYLDLAWKHLSHDGLLVVDYVNPSNKSVYDSFTSFCRIQNRTPAFYNTRYGIGIIQK